MGKVQGASPVVEHFKRGMAIQFVMIERVAEMLETVHTGRLTGRRTLLGQAPCRTHHIRPVLQQLFQQARATRHGVIQQRIYRLTPRFAYHLYLEIGYLHIQNVGCSLTQRLHDAVGRFLGGAVLQY
ncbi:hypothetical protein D3C85_1263990 [compost metagenome]